MADTTVPSIKDVSDFAEVIAAHPAAGITAFILLLAAAILIGIKSTLPTVVTSIVTFVVLGFELAAGGYAIYKVFPSANVDTDIVFKLKLADETIRLESVALNTYIGGVDGEKTWRRVLFRSKDAQGDWVSIRTTRVCPPNEVDGCPAADFSLPVWLLRAGEARHFRDTGSGTGVVVFPGEPLKNCTVFPDPKPSEKPKTYGGPNLCPASPPSQRSGSLIRPGSWWIGTAWAADPAATPSSLAAVRPKLASTDAKVREDGRLELQKASNAAALLAELIAEPAGSETRNRVVANALIAAIYFGDEKWKDVTAPTKNRIMALLTDSDDLVSRYAKSVLRRYPEDAILAQVRTAAGSATGADKKKLAIALSDIEYNVGVMRLQEARTGKTDAGKWQATAAAFQAGVAAGQGLPGAGKSEPDVTKNFFGLALSTADKWSNARPAGMTTAQVKDAFAHFLGAIEQESYPYSEQIEAANCVKNIAAAGDAPFDKSLGECLKFFR